MEFFPNKKQQSAKLRIKNGSPICNNSTNNPANNNRYCAFDDINISNKQFEYECIYSPLGSPLMIYSNGIWYVYGISTWYDPSSFVCVAYNPSYYTMVPNYIDWIDYNIISWYNTITQRQKIERFFICLYLLYLLYFFKK